MNTRTKEILKEGINIHRALNMPQTHVNQIKENLKMHYNGLNNIGIGLDSDMVRAGEIFLRIFNN
jgi:hypothetical protein